MDDTNGQLRSILETAHKNDIVNALHSSLSIPFEIRRSKSVLIKWAIDSVPREIITPLVDRLPGSQSSVSSGQKRKRAESSVHHRIVRSRIAEDADIEPNFVQLPSAVEIKQAYRRFFTATSQKALHSVVCAVCGRECGPMDEHCQRMCLSKLPNWCRLKPLQPHPAHLLTHGLLLESKGLEVENGTTYLNICMSCWKELNNAQQTTPPHLSLANGLWIGNTPLELQRLTFAEQLLIALLYPRVYVFKLFPKKVGGTRTSTNLQRGLRGNVSVYQLNQTAITSMVEGKLMPRPPAILASLIAITFIGVGALPEKWLGGMFRVRRQAVTDALLWLKVNNPKYYGDIQIDSLRLHSLPRDDVPEEVINLVHQSSDTEIVDQEGEGYVPQVMFSNHIVLFCHLT